jgi:hypothetical protein
MGHSRRWAAGGGVVGSRTPNAVINTVMCVMRSAKCEVPSLHELRTAPGGTRRHRVLTINNELESHHASPHPHPISISKTQEAHRIPHDLHAVFFASEKQYIYIYIISASTGWIGSSNQPTTSRQCSQHSGLCCSNGLGCLSLRG